MSTPVVTRTPLSPEQVVGTALAIADEEGFEAVSMRRVAARLGAGTMTLYGHVEGRDELLALMYDEVAREFLLEEVPSDWRVALTEIAQRSRAALLRHYWVLNLGMLPAKGPHLLRHIEQSIAATERMGLDTEDRRAVIFAVDDLVSGSVLRELGRGLACSNPARRFEESLRWLLDGIERDLVQPSTRPTGH
jgi:AcrR family transcriptional regulator